MSTYRRRRTRLAENAVVGVFAGICATLAVALYVALAAAPLVLLAFVLHWLGAF